MSPKSLPGHKTRLCIPVCTIGCPIQRSLPIHMQSPPPGAGLALYHVDPYDIVSMLLETLGYGLFLVLFLVSIMLLLQRRRADKTSGRMKRSVSFYLITGVLMFLVITAVRPHVFFSQCKKCMIQKWTFWWAEALPIPAHTIATQLPRRSRTTYRLKEACIQTTVLLGDAITVRSIF